MPDQEQRDVILNGSKPFESFAAAKLHCLEKAIPDNRYEIVEVDGGFGIRMHHGSPKDIAKTLTASAKKVKVEEEKCFRVVFANKTNKNDTDDVVLSVNGEVMVIQREKEIVIPERYKVCADNALQAQFRQMPGETRKIVGYVMAYPYRLLGDATWEEWMAYRRRGAEANRRYTESTMKPAETAVAP